MNKYHKFLLDAYNYGLQINTMIGGKNVTIRKMDGGVFLINGERISKSYASPLINKGFIAAYNEMFMSVMPVRLVNSQFEGPYSDYRLCSKHNGSFWPNVMCDVKGFTDQHKCACPNYHSFLLWFGNVHPMLSKRNMFVEFYDSTIERVCGTNGHQIGIAKSATPKFNMPYNEFYQRYAQNKGNS